MKINLASLYQEYQLKYHDSINGQEMSHCFNVLKKITNFIEKNWEPEDTAEFKKRAKMEFYK